MASHSMDSSLSVWSNASSSGTSTGSDGPVVVRHTPGAIHGVIGSGRRTVVDELNSSSNGGPQREHIDARLQLELAIVRRKLRATELAYKQLENDYLSIRDAHSTVLVVLGDSHSDGQTHSGEERAQHVLEAIRADLEGQHLHARIQVIYNSRDAQALSGAPALESVLTVYDEKGEKLQYLLGTLSPFSQVKRVYVSLSPATASCVLVPVLKDIIEGRNISYHRLPASLECSPSLSSPGWTSPTSTHTSNGVTAHGRKQSESASDCSTAATSVSNGHTYAKNPEHQEGPHAMLDKIRLLSAGDGGDEGVLAGVAEQLKSLYRGNDEMIAQLEEMDISSLFSRLEIPTLAASQAPSTMQADPDDVAAAQSTSESTLVADLEFDAPALVPLKTASSTRGAARTSKDKTVSNAKLRIAIAGPAEAKAAVLAPAKEPVSADTRAVSPIAPVKSLSSPVPAEPSAMHATLAAESVSAAATPEMSAGGWADVVRKGKKSTPQDGAVGSASSPSTPVLGSSKTGFDDDHEGGQNVKAGLGSVSPCKPRATQNAKWTPLDPNLPLCKQKIPPCNMYYIGFGCSNSKCNYGHEYKLNAAQREELRLGALRTVCTYKRARQACVTGKDCVFGHVCPQGKKCKLGSKCQFPPHMHTA